MQITSTSATGADAPAAGARSDAPPAPDPAAPAEPEHSAAAGSPAAARPPALSWHPTWRSTLAIAGALALGIGVLLVVRLIARPLGFLILAIALAEALSPLVKWLARRMARSAAIGLVFLGVLLVVATIARIVIPPLIAQGQELVNRAPELIAAVQRWIAEWDEAMGGQFAGMLSFWPRRIGEFVVGLPRALVSALFNVLLVVFLAAYWLIGAPALHGFALSLFPERRRPSVGSLLDDMGRAMGGYVRGAAVNAVIMGTLAWLGLLAIGVNYAAVLGVLTMLAEPIPIIGPFLVSIPVGIVALLQSPSKALLAVGLFAALQQLEAHLVAPSIMRKQTDVPQTLVIFAILAGGVIGGLLGVLVSIPLVAALRVFVLRVVVPTIQRWTGAGA